jgi:hypothetical protein
MQNQRFAVLGAALGMFMAAWIGGSAALAQGGAEKIWPTA